MSTWTNAEQLMHELLVASVPAESHPADCPMCAAATHDQEATVATEDDIKAAVDAALAESAAKIAELEAKLADRDKAATETAVSQLQAKLDDAVAGRKAAEEELGAITAYLEAELAKAVEAEAVAARRDVRLEAVRATAVFPDSYVEENAQRWAALDDDAWVTQLAEYQAIAAARPAQPSEPNVEDKPPPQVSAMTASATEPAAAPSPIAEVLALRGRGVDLRQII